MSAESCHMHQKCCEGLCFFFPEKVTLIVLFACLPYFYLVLKNTEQY